jgi:hypothetical protein
VTGSRHDPRIAVRVRAELTRRRREGLPWSNRTFDLIVQRALIGQNHAEKAAWYAAFRSHRRLWRSAYERTADLGSYRLDLKLLDREPADESPASSRFVLIR